MYHDYAKDQQIFDYHCHLPPQQVAENYRFKNLYDCLLYTSDAADEARSVDL
ncbi:hypothetical protein ELM61_29805, partial [Klebsiella pneumoniae]|nr:hypothetical protein [Klebsiella pneumoniae]